jgi:hypothetical protein
MKRTLIITIETTGEDTYRTMEAAEEAVLDNCDAIANSYQGCSVNAEICVEAMADALISELCNTGNGRTIQDALERAWSHVHRSLEIAEGDEDPPEDIDGMRSDLEAIETAQKLLIEEQTP